MASILFPSCECNWLRVSEEVLIQILKLSDQQVSRCYASWSKIRKVKAFSPDENGIDLMLAPRSVQELVVEQEAWFFLSKSNARTISLSSGKHQMKTALGGRVVLPLGNNCLSRLEIVCHNFPGIRIASSYPSVGAWEQWSHSSSVAIGSTVRICLKGYFSIRQRARKFYQRNWKEIIIDGSSMLDMMNQSRMFQCLKWDILPENAEHQELKGQQEIGIKMVLVFVGSIHRQKKKFRQTWLLWHSQILRPTPLDLSYSGLEEFKQPKVNEYGPRDSSVKPTNGCDKESYNSKENTNDSLKQQQKTDSSSIKSPLKVDKDWKEKFLCPAGTHDGKKKRDLFYQHQEAGKQEKNQMGLLTMDDGIVNWGEHTEVEETNHALMAISSSNELGNQEAQILAYSQAVKKLEAQLVTFQKQQLSSISS
ncbi:hypothetical protein Tco_0543632 [Tanacetum coccineum]